MNLIRLVVTISALVLLAGGYGASQWAVWHGNAQAYHAAVDQPAIKILALVLLLAAIILAFSRQENVER